MPANSLQKRPRARGVLFQAAAVLVVALSTLAVQARPTQAATARTVESPSSAAKCPVMLADEITRRLRRMGINFSRTQLPHPYDPVGEVC